MIQWLWEKVKTCPSQLLWLRYWEVTLFWICENYFIGSDGLQCEPNPVPRLDVANAREEMCRGNFACGSCMECVVHLIFLHFGNISCEILIRLAAIHLGYVHWELYNLVSNVYDILSCFTILHFPKIIDIISFAKCIIWFHFRCFQIHSLLQPHSKS